MKGVQFDLRYRHLQFTYLKISPLEPAFCHSLNKGIVKILDFGEFLVVSNHLKSLKVSGVGTPMQGRLPLRVKFAGIGSSLEKIQHAGGAIVVGRVVQKWLMLRVTRSIGHSCM